MNVRRLILDAALKGFGVGFHGSWIAALLRLDQLLVIGERKLGVDRQPARTSIGVATRQPNGKFDALIATGSRDDVPVVLRAGQYLLEQTLELHLAPRASRLDVG